MMDHVKELAELLKKADANAEQKFITDYEDAILDNAEYLIANDVVPVVRCSHCKHYTEDHLCFHPKQEYGCNSQGGECLQMEANDFCSYGERKTDNGNL